MPACEVLRRHSALLLLAAVLALPLAVATISLHDEDWAPLFDVAMIEMRVRDVGGEHTPLIGVNGRLEALGQLGNHPGPLLFFLLAPLHHLLGDAAWALQLSSAIVQALAIVLALSLAARQGRPAMIGTAAGLALLMQGYGLSLLTEPWNPHLPVLWFAVFLVAAWSLARGNAAALPLLVGSGTLCAQCHVSYVPPCFGFGAAAVAAMALQLEASPREERRPVVRAMTAAAALFALLWLPPAVEEVTARPGNLTILVNAFLHPREKPIGLYGALHLCLEHLDAWHIVVDPWVRPGAFTLILEPPVPDVFRGAGAFVAWLACAGVAVRSRYPALITLHGVVALGLVLAILSLSRITGIPWNYLSYWAWSLGVVLLIASIATIVHMVTRRLALHPSAPKLGGLLGVAIVVLLSARLTSVAPETRPSSWRVTRQLRALVNDTKKALEGYQGPATGFDGRYVVTWTDPFNAGIQAIGLMNELERAGFRVGGEHGLSDLLEAHRLFTPAVATARIHLATGASIKWIRLDERAVMVAYADRRTKRELREQRQLRKRIIRALSAVHRDDVIDAMKEHPGAAETMQPPLPGHIRLLLRRYVSLGGPAAVFLMPEGPAPSTARPDPKVETR